MVEMEGHPVKEGMAVGMLLVLGFGWAKGPGEGSRRRGGKGMMCRIRSWTFEIPANHRLEFLERAGFNIKLPFEVRAHFALHLVDLAKGEHALTDDAPGLVGVGIITDDLRGNHKR
jgi:hypothetical protein